MSRVSRQSDKMDFHNYGSVEEPLAGAKTPLPDSPAKPPPKKGKADDDSSSVVSTLSNLINTRSDTKEKMDVRAESIRICEATFPEGGSSLADKIDTVHHVGRRLQNSSRPRPIIIQFSSRVTRDGVWRAARTSEFLRANQLHFTEDLIASDRERRQLLWPAVDKARKEGKRAHFVGGHAFVDGSEIHPP
ncbi:hypothetical protein DPX16_0173 [Anabarilius grahami]|uniref:Uncharacterized protein n=1 Tax=Anabarilius grahami TaxID=495550 RepID=A0A3N0Y9E9_ANAGA|nr:hypothetical protein DPX16_0173 [Anabarilius grahami]